MGIKNTGIWAAYLAAGLFPMLMWVWPIPLKMLANNRSLADFLHYVPLLALAGAGVMGWKLNQTRVLLASFMCMALYGLFLRAESLFPATIYSMVQDALAISVPLAFALTVSGRESPLMDRRMVRRLLLICAPFLVLGGAVAWARVGFYDLVNWSPAGVGRFFDLPWVSVGVVAVYAVAVGLSSDRRIRGFAVALGFTLVPILFAVRVLSRQSINVVEGLPGIHLTTAFLAVSLVLFHAVFSLYWQRVYMDDLTGVPNRRALEEELQNVGGNYAVAMIDIDHFKAYNDRFGHEEGDNVLRMVASHLESELRARVYRYGGEEFCVLWNRETLDGAFRVMEKARCSLEKRVFHVRSPRHESGSPPPDSALGVAVGVTISAGLAIPGAGNTAPEEVLRMADEALYEAKRAGRNQTVVANS